MSGLFRHSMGPAAGFNILWQIKISVPTRDRTRSFILFPVTLLGELKILKE